MKGRHAYRGPSSVRCPWCYELMPLHDYEYAHPYPLPDLPIRRGRHRRSP